MQLTPSLSIVVPALNEEARLAPTLTDTIAYLRQRGEPWEIIVVDDGSSDGTSALVNALSADAPELRLIRLPSNRGKGYAVRMGMVNSRGQRVLFMDADGSTPIREIERLEQSLADGAEVAIGSRAVPDETVRVRARFYRRVIGRVFHLLVSRLAVGGFHDTQCGFKLFSADAAHELFSRMRMDGFSFDVEVLLMAARQGYVVREVPVNWTHCPGSRVNMVRDSWRMFRDLFVIRAHVLRGDYAQPRVAVMLTPPRGSVRV